jgi:hypothetical protein
MKQGKHIRFLVAAMCCMVFVALLGGCVAQSAGQSTSDDQASQNRQYMAQLNQKMGNLQSVMNDFQTAVSQKNVVGMKAQATAADKIIDGVKNTDATDRLSDVKNGYVDGLCTLENAMNSYVDLYSDVQNGTVDSASYQARLQDVQSAYDQGVSKLKAADDEVAQISNE